MKIIVGIFICTASALGIFIIYQNWDKVIPMSVFTFFGFLILFLTFLVGLSFFIPYETIKFNGHYYGLLEKRCYYLPRPRKVEHIILPHVYKKATLITVEGHIYVIPGWRSIRQGGYYIPIDFDTDEMALAGPFSQCPFDPGKN